MADWMTVAHEGEIEPGRAVVVEVAGRRLALCNVEGQYYCIDDVCTHDGGPLGEGELIEDQIECPRHGALFDVKTGRAVTLPAVLPVDTHEVRVESGEIKVRVDE